jgi:hypothetical protein
MAKKPRTLRGQSQSRAAYKLVDLSDLHPETRKDIIQDAGEGGGVYGIRVVEESINGGARAPIYGYYIDGPDAERWADAKKQLGLDADEVDDSTVYGQSIEVDDPEREALLREQAEEQANAEAAAHDAAEEAEISAITGDGEDEVPARVPPLSHSANRVDETLAADATNEAGDAENQKAPKAAKTKTPR